MSTLRAVTCNRCCWHLLWGIILLGWQRFCTMMSQDWYCLTPIIISRHYTDTLLVSSARHGPSSISTPSAPLPSKQRIYFKSFGTVETGFHHHILFHCYVFWKWDRTCKTLFTYICFSWLGRASGTWMYIRKLLKYQPAKLMYNFRWHLSIFSCSLTTVSLNKITSATRTQDTSNILDFSSLLMCCIGKKMGFIILSGSFPSFSVHFSLEQGLAEKFSPYKLQTSSADC